MTTPQLRLETEVVDKFSRPLKDFQAALRAIGAPRSAKEIKRDFDGAGAAVLDASRQIRDRLSPALAGLGLGGLSAAAGLAAAVNAVRTFAANTGSLSAMARETGFSEDAMRTLLAAAQRFQIAPETVRASLKTLAANLYDFRRQWGETYNWLVGYEPGLAKALHDASPDKAVEILLDNFSRIKDRQTAALVAMRLTGNREFAQFGQEGPETLKKVFAETYARIGQLSPPDAAKLRAYNQAIETIRSSVEGLRKTVSVSLAPTLTELTEWADRYIRLNKAEIGDAVARAALAIGNAVAEINRAVQGSIGWRALLTGLAAARVVDASGAFLKLGGAFIGLGRAVAFANLGGLSKIFAALGAVGAVFAVSRSARGPSSGANATARSDGAAIRAPQSPADPGMEYRNASRLGAAASEGVEKGVARGLEAVASLGGVGGASRGAGVTGGLAAALGGSRLSGISMLRAAAARGRMPPAQSLGGQAGKWWTSERQRYAIDYLMKHAGLSEYGAAGLVARWAAVEAKGGPGSRNPRSGAEGVGQWLGSRKRPGVTDTPNLEPQLAHAAWELNNTERRAGDALRAARNPWEGARGASMYERAEGYSARTGLDAFTRATPAGSVHDHWAAGGAIARARSAGVMKRGRGDLPLIVRIVGMPRGTRISSDGGTAFPAGIDVQRVRPSHGDQ